MRVKEESEKAGLKLNVHKTKTIASDPITSWQRKGKNGSFDYMDLCQQSNVSAF